MNIGETITTLPVLDAPVGAAAAAHAEGGEGFAERLAAALGDAEGAALPKAGAAVAAPEGGPPVPAGVALLVGQVTKAATALLDGGGVASGEAAPVAEDAGAEGPEVDLQASVALEEPAEGIPREVSEAMPADAALSEHVTVEAVEGEGGGEGGAVDVPVPAVPSTVTVAAPVPVAVAADKGAAVAPVGGAKRGAAPVVPVSVTVETAPTGQAAPMPAADARAALAAAATEADSADAADAAPVAEAGAGAGAVRGKAKGEAPALGAEPAAARVVDPAVAAPLAAAQKVVSEVDLKADQTGPVMSQMPQALPQTAERMAAQPLRTDLPGWEQVLSERIAAELSEDGQEIELSLSPEKLGPLRIKLEMVDGLAQVKFITTTPEAARVFTEAQHRLSEGLARAGVDLGQQSAQSAGGQSMGGRQGGQADDRSAPRGRMNEFLTHSRRVEAGDAPALRRSGAGLVNLMA